ncbi:hypothetical protein MWN63_15345 [Paradonghicola geojensis]|nr:hypothetical protein [Marivivens geojensis]
MVRKIVLKVTIASALFVAGQAFAASDQPNWLFVQTSNNLSSNGTTLTLSYDREIFAFTDRPYRMHAFLNSHEMANLWELGKDSFAEDPPNAVLTWLEGDHIREVEVELLSASVDDLGRSISYQFASTVASEVPEAASYVSLFVDDVAGAVKEGVCDVTKDQIEEGLVSGVFEMVEDTPPVGATQAGVAWLMGKSEGCY